MTVGQVRHEYPRPQFVRDSWLNLNGLWDFEFDDGALGIEEGWYKVEGPQYSKNILVPYCFQSELSGIGSNDFHDVVWYKRSVELPTEWDGKRKLLHFGAVDYKADVWVNGQYAGNHEGGHTPFTLDITHLVGEGKQCIVIRAEDYSKDVTLTRGKQYWKEKSEIIFYTRTTGIWQTVWLEAVHKISINRVKFLPDIDRNEIRISYFIDGLSTERLASKVELKTKISFEDEVVVEDRIAAIQQRIERTIALDDYNDHGLGRWWSPEKPQLYDVEFELVVDGVVLDKVESYFGMRKISVEHGHVCLNNRPYYMKLVLDQGYFPKGVMTAPSDDDLRKDVELTKAMGFNGARKHQKIEDPRYLYWCDKLGLLLWGEMANAYAYSKPYVGRIVKEWTEAVERDYNHPCLVVWVPLNESWGIPNVLIDGEQQHHALTMYHLTKSLDSSRLVISNDGWEHLKSDLYTVHDYEWREEVLRTRYSTIEGATDAPQKREMYVGGYQYAGEPLLISEFGGISFQKSEWEGWGYSGASDDEDFKRRLEAVFNALHQSPLIQGYCYTQLTDVEQEINGLLTYEREPKVPIEAIRQIVTGK